MIPIPIPNRLGARRTALALVGACGLFLAACSGGSGSARGTNQKSVVVTYTILGSLVRDAVGDQAEVTVLIPNGADPHDWEPSAKDIERLNKADLIVRNGLGLEGGMQDALDRARDKGVATFVATDHVTVRTVGEGEGLPTEDPDQAPGAPDPHIWMDPLTLKQVMVALAPALSAEGIQADGAVAAVTAELDKLNTEIEGLLAAVPEANRKLVTGHESLGYFAQRYRFRLVGAIVPSLTTQAGVSADALARLTRAIQGQQVRAIFTEVGTPKAVVEAISKQTGVPVVALAAHNLPKDGKYSTFLAEDAKKVAAALA